MSGCLYLVSQVQNSNGTTLDNSKNMYSTSEVNARQALKCLAMSPAMYTFARVE